ncbi:MAG: hypothetical protein HOK21_03445 [Rhodospirillaceae bacterium]|nr:hypothetical protein [Rhodospirillaceae bacterium]MBT4045229.1 hypothetical protein [Rhodospirillaceae bacterium]MBT4688167.1 hypothetical protein [Rhodospirillaceae bacterium]MBT5081893.1 hypothetical protein [Rhodospirillaceae bacterium]MBT5523116.1 hypothetical protein [Rhodospirillaceae bacterium]
MGKKSQKETESGQKTSAEQRQERLAKALRENLRRRKQHQVSGRALPEAARPDADRPDADGPDKP